MFDGHTYRLKVAQGSVTAGVSGSLYRIYPRNNRIVLKLSDQ